MKNFSRISKIEKAVLHKRFQNLKNIKKAIEQATGEKVHVFKSESERPKGIDFMIDYEFDENEVYTLFYLKDNNNHYYITEV